MTGDRWDRVREILEGALGHPPEQRADFLDQACASDRELRNEVEALLACDDEGDSFLENSPLPSAFATEHRDRLSAPAGPSLVGRTLSSYEILAEIGRGGIEFLIRVKTFLEKH